MKSQIKHLILMLLLFSSNEITATATASDTLKLSVKESIQLGLKNNPDMKRVQLEESAILLQIQMAKASALPQISANGRYTDNFALPQQLLPGEIFGQEGQIPVTFGVRHALNAGLELNQMLYNKTYLENIKKLSAVKQTSALQIMATTEDLVYKILQTYIEIQTTNRQQQILVSNLSRQSQLLKIAQAQYDNGIIKRLDVDQLAVNQTNLETELNITKIGAEQQINILRFYLALDMDQPIVLTEDLENSDRFNLSSELLLTENINYQLLQKQKEINALEVGVINAGYQPTVSAFLQYNYNGQGNDFNFKESNYVAFSAGLWGLSVSIPIFDGFQRKKKIQENIIKSKQISLDEESLKLATKMDYSNANIKLLQNEKLINNQRANMQLAQNVYDATQLSYQEGVAALSELINSENSLKQAQTQYLSALLNFKKAELDHVKASGQLAQLIKNI